MELMQLLGELVALGVEIISVMAIIMNNGRYCVADTIACSHSQRSNFLCILALSWRLHGCGIVCLDQYTHILYPALFGESRDWMRFKHKRRSKSGSEREGGALLVWGGLSSMDVQIESLLVGLRSKWCKVIEVGLEPVGTKVGEREFITITRARRNNKTTSQTRSRTGKEPQLGK